MTIESDAITIYRPAMHKWVAAFVFAGSLILAVAGIAQFMRDRSWMAPDWSGWAIGGGVVGILFSVLWPWLAVPLPGRRRGKAGSLSFGDEHVELCFGFNKVHLAYDRLQGIWFEQAGADEWLMMRTRTGSEIGVQLGAEAAARARSALQDAQLDANAVTMRLSNRTGWMRVVYIFGVMLFGSLALVLVVFVPYQCADSLFNGLWPPRPRQWVMLPAIAMLAMLIGLGCALLVRFMLRAVYGERVTVGVDGVDLRRPLMRRRFVPFEQLQSVRVRIQEPAEVEDVLPQGVTDVRAFWASWSLARQQGVGLKTHTTTLWIGGSAGEVACEALAAVIEKARSRRVGWVHESLLTALDQQGRDATSWHADLLGLVDKQSGHRDQSLSPALLLRAATDPHTSVERRVAAALALSTVADDAAKQSIHKGADACANPSLRDALRRAVDGELDEKQLERVGRDDASMS